MTQTAADLESTFRRAWALLLQNLVIVVPGLIAGGIIVIVTVAAILFFAGSFVVASSSHGAVGSVGWALLGFGIVVCLAIFAYVGGAGAVATTAMAAEAWETGTTSLSTGWAAVARRGWTMFFAVILLGLILCVALLLALPTLLLSLLAYATFFLYVTASVVIGGRDAAESIGESCHLAAKNFWPTLGIAALIFVISIIAAGVGGVFSHATPFFGGLIAMAIQQAAVAYAALVVVGEYTKLQQP